MFRRVVLALALCAAAATAHDTSAPPSRSYSFQQPTPAPPQAPAPQVLGFSDLTRIETGGRTETPTPSTPAPTIGNLRSAVDDKKANEAPQDGEVAGEYVRGPASRLRMRATF